MIFRSPAYQIPFLQMHNAHDYVKVPQMVKNLPAMRETWVWSLGWKNPLEKGMATHSSTLAWRIPMDRGAWGHSPWGHKESDMIEWLSTAHMKAQSIPVAKKSVSPAFSKVCMSVCCNILLNPRGTHFGKHNTYIYIYFLPVSRYIQIDSA